MFICLCLSPSRTTCILNQNLTLCPVKYSHEIQTQQEAIEQVKREEQMLLPEDLDYFR